jgi:hypothetical protein
MRYGAISSHDLFSHENPGRIMGAAYGLAMLALKSGAPLEQRVEALDRLYDRFNINPLDALKQPDRSAALQFLADKAKIKLTITPGVVEGFIQVLEELVRRKTSALQGEIDQRQQQIGDLGKFESANAIVNRLLE